MVSTPPRPVRVKTHVIAYQHVEITQGCVHGPSTSHPYLHGAGLREQTPISRKTFLLNSGLRQPALRLYNSTLGCYQSHDSHLREGNMICMCVPRLHASGSGCPRRERKQDSLLRQGFQSYDMIQGRMTSSIDDMPFSKNVLHTEYLSTTG